MLVSHKFDHDNKVIITTFAPEDVDLKLFMKAFAQYQEELKYLPDFQEYDELVDFRPITDINITAAELKEFSELTMSKDARDSVTKLALLVDSRPAFTLAKIYETIRNFSPSSGKKVKVFRDADDAYAWFREDR